MCGWGNCERHMTINGSGGGGWGNPQGGYTAAGTAIGRLNQLETAMWR